MDYIKLAKDNEDLIIQMRRDLHQIPELELDLPKTSKYVKDRLDEWQIPYKELIDGNAIVALVEGQEAGKCLAVRADMDALPVTEETGLDYASKHEGRMHACGHDGHTALALSLCKVLNEHKDKIKGSVKFIFQPGEEIPGGAKPMIEEGALEDPRPDNIIGIHQGGLFEAESGTLGFKANELMASMDRFSIKVTGKGGHGAHPHNTVDPVVIAGEIILGVQKIVSREISPIERALVSICKIEGGSSQNIIPDEVNMLGTARTLNEETRDIVEKRLEEISKGIAQTYGGDAQVVYERMYPVLSNDPDFTSYAMNIASNLFPEDTVELDLPQMGGEDMAFFLQEIPGTFVFMNNLAEHSDGIRYPNHNSKFNLDESTFYKGLAFLLALSFDYLGE